MNTIIKGFCLLVTLAVLAMNQGCGKSGVEAGSDGSNGKDGAVGAQGTAGTNGTNGTNGSNGVDGSTITTVQLCPGFVPTYPNVFPEFALCINNNLFGVYSAKGGFMAELPPGRYHSEGVGSVCDLTVASNCQVGE